MDQIKKGTYNSSRGEKTFKEFAGNWLVGKLSIKDATRISYEGIANNHLIPYFGDGRISEIRRRTYGIREGENGRRKAIPEVHPQYPLVLHQILDDAQVEGVVIHNPYLKIERPRTKKVEQDYLRTDEIPVFLQNCELSNYALFNTFIFTGVRRGEAIGLKWGDIDWVNSQVYVRRSYYKGQFVTLKSKYSIRRINIGPRLVAILKEHRAKQNQIRLKAGGVWKDQDLVFCHNDGSALDPDNLYHRDLKKVLKRQD